MWTAGSRRPDCAPDCGALAVRMPLAVRSWTCRCGQAHDRDVDAARNILAEGLSVTACGGGVRPHRESSSRTGRSSAKQEPLGRPRESLFLQGGEEVKPDLGGPVVNPVGS
ncbi:zinc ribbon domain-containing protein [Solwaraspora sp. WMMA2065]|uniref:zinc ribbon domain-containing protein n=1 Tax=Solwaraspora sp. WMMA2065 TaxID=3015166 RepID=UPI00338D85B4